MAIFFAGVSGPFPISISTAPQLSDLYIASYPFSAPGSKPFR